MDFRPRAREPREPREPRDAAQRTYATEISVPRLGDDGTQRLHSRMPDPEPPATAADVLAVLQGKTTGPEAGAALASYFAPGPEPRYDTRQAQAQAQAEAEGRLVTTWLAQDYEAREGQDADVVTASPAELAAEYNHGAETGSQLTTLAAANGRAADYIAARQLELTGPASGPDERTAAERERERGFARGGESALALLRELEAADAASREAEPELEAGS